ncbi:MAG: SRPBCC domain-containing protein [Crocinitomicaceae bacterium]
MKTEIKHEWIFSQPIEEIWKYLTKAELIEKWLMSNNFEPIVGHEFKFTTNPIPDLELDGNFYCTVIEIIPLKKLVYSWKGGPNMNKVVIDTMVEWNLRASDEGTVLNLLHSGFTDSNQAICGGMFEGWARNINRMLDSLK